MKAKSYITQIREQVKADHGGEVPKRLDLTIRNYASALETRDMYRDKIAQEGATITKQGSNFQTITVQHPLCGLLYQQEMLCLSYAKALGGTSAKQAVKAEDPGSKQATDKLNEFIEATQG